MVLHSSFSMVSINTNANNNNKDLLDDQTFAVIVDSVKFAYTPETPVLKGVSLHVPRAKIYALLGPNGCGKTTLLNILLGRLRPESGRVHILGHSITSKRATKLNHFMGFMPQEIALDPLLNISETFHYFSKINHVRDANFVEEKIKSYLQMLQLKDDNQLVESLSGGQKRLLSLGVTLIYEPKILLLDEPTVGVDSMIREKIWSHLRQICDSNKTSVIITTHYMEEAATSDMVGFIRAGEILAEHSPKFLMSMLGCDILEEVFYRICVQQSQLRLSGEQQNRFLKYIKADDSQNEPANKHQRHSDSGGEDSEFYHYEINGDSIAQDSVIGEDNKQSRKVRLQSSPDIEIFARLECAKSRLVCFEHVSALLYREWISFRTNTFSLSLFILAPILAITLFFITYGKTPSEIPCATVNHDEGIMYNNENLIIANYYFSEMAKICTFQPHDSVDEAIESVRLGRSSLAVTVSRNFSRAFLQRYNQYDKSKPRPELDEDEYAEMISDSQIKTYRDQSRVITSRFLNVSLLGALHETINVLAQKLSIDHTMLSSPLDMKEIIYGDMEIDFQPTLMAGILIISQIGLVCMFASLKINRAKQNGCLERDLNQSVSSFELNLAFHVVPLFSIALQTMIAGSWTFLILKSPFKGNFFEALALLYFTNLQGLFIGSLISTFSTSSFGSILVSFFIMMAFLFTSGTIWPIEAMREPMQTIFTFNPITLSTQAIRSIALRNWSLFTHWGVALPFVTTTLTSLTMFVVQSIAFAYTVRQK